MSTAPHLVLVPGSFSYAAHYGPTVRPHLDAGRKIHVLEPPCYPAQYQKGTPPPSMYADAAYINSFVSELADSTGADIVVLAHSYGGIPASESLKGVTKSEREKAGKKGGVVRIAYITALVPALGKSAMETVDAELDYVQPDEDGWLQHVKPDVAAAACFNHLSKEDGLKHAHSFGKHSSTCFVDPLTYNGYKDVPVSYFFCEDDQCVSPAVQQRGIDAIEESWKGTEREGTKVDVTRVWSDHVPNYSHPEELGKWIDGLFV